MLQVFQSHDVVWVVLTANHHGIHTFLLPPADLCNAVHAARFTAHGAFAVTLDACFNALTAEDRIPARAVLIGLKR